MERKVFQPGKETKEQVNIDGVSVEAKSDSEDGIKFGSNTSRIK